MNQHPQNTIPNSTRPDGNAGKDDPTEPQAHPALPGASRRAFVATVAALTATPILKPLASTLVPSGRAEQPERIERIAAHSLQQAARILSRAAAEAGLSLETAGLSMVARRDAVGVAATIAGLERIPATELIHGIDTGFLFLAGADRLPADYYLVRVTTQTVQVGDNAGLVELIHLTGRVVLRQEIIVTVESLTLPERPPGLIPTTAIGIVHTGDHFDHPCAFEICFLCSNGYGVICLRVAIPSCFVFAP